jgi:hypothetical protein
MARWISPPFRRSAATPFNRGVEATFAADRPVGQSLMDERVDQQTPLRSPAQRTTVRAYGCDHFGDFLLCSYVRAWISSPLRFSLRGRLRPSFRPSFRGPARPKARQRPSQRRLRAWRFADIPTPPPGQNIKSVTAVVIALSIFSASLALDACAIASALAPQRLSITSATVIASALATTQTPIGSALASQHFAVNRSRAWGSA